MSIESDLKTALAQFGFPVVRNIYTGAEPAYFVLTINAMPTAFADNEPRYERNLIMVHLYCPHTQDTTALRKNIKVALQSAGFTYPAELDASDGEKQHVVFECQDARAV